MLSPVEFAAITAIVYARTFPLAIMGDMSPHLRFRISHYFTIQLDLRVCFICYGVVAVYDSPVCEAVDE
jgi:hypothetical protein